MDLFDTIAPLFERGHAAPSTRLWHDPRIDGIETFIPAAVLIAVTERERPGILFLHRPSNMRAHAGQVAFPGGRIDPGETPVEAALREAWEELGIPPDLVRTVGTTDIYRTGSGYEITPVLAVIPPDIEIRPNPAEVSQWFEAPANFVLDPANHKPKTLQRDGQTITFIDIQWQGHSIWGVTGAIVHNLTKRLHWHG